jgi:hemerythrin HHE cation binding domain-containing protein
MCEYCGCQQIATIGELTAEHDAVVAEMSMVRTHLAAGRRWEAAVSCRRIATILGPHTLVEEEGLFPELAGEFPTHVAALQAEHRRIESVLAEAQDAVPSDPTWPTRLLTTFVVLREHILKEQDGMFPAALVSLDSSQWERVESVRARAMTELSRHDPRGGNGPDHQLTD